MLALLSMRAGDALRLRLWCTFIQLLAALAVLAVVMQFLILPACLQYFVSLLSSKPGEQILESRFDRHLKNSTVQVPLERFDVHLHCK